MTSSAFQGGRRSRDARPERRAGRITQRDIELLTFVGRARAVTTDALATVFFGDKSTASRRLARLTGAGLLKVHVEHLNAPNWYTLTPRGAEILLGEGLDEESLFVGRLPKRETLAHLRLLNEFRAALVAAVEARSDVSIELFLADHDLRRLAGANVPAYVPDAIVELRCIGRAPLGLVVEIDRALELSSFFARTKGAFTLAARRANEPLWGLAQWRPIVLVPTLARLRALAKALAEVGAEKLWLGSTFETIQRQGVLGPAFTTLAAVAETRGGSEISFPLRLAPSPHGGTP